MLAIADSAQRGLFDSSWCGNVVPRDSFYGLLAEHGERIVCDEDFADCYAGGRGRPSIPPSLLAKVLLLAYRCGLSDRQAVLGSRRRLGGRAAEQPSSKATPGIGDRARSRALGLDTPGQRDRGAGVWSPWCVPGALGTG